MMRLRSAQTGRMSNRREILQMKWLRPHLLVCAVFAVAIATSFGGCGGGKGGGMAGTGGIGGTGGGGGGTACLETDAPGAIAVTCQACLDASSDPATDGCCSLAVSDPAGYTLCQAASACMRAGGPPTDKCNVGGDVTTCYCGTHPASCDQPGGPDGPCVAEITAAAGRNVVTKTTDTPTEAQIIDRQGDIDFAFGRAATIQTIAGAFCSTECGL